MIEVEFRLILIYDVSMTSRTDKYLSELKLALQAMKPLEFEQTSARLLSSLIDQQVYIAKSGFQYGGDAGTGGDQDRFLRLECKRYKDSSKLNERELLGEIDQALERDPYLEAWILATPKKVNEQLHGTLIKKGNNLGVAVIFLSWDDDEEKSPLAAGCSIYRSCLPDHYKTKLPQPPPAYLSTAEQSVTEIKRQLEGWAIGFETVRKQAQLRLDKIWKSENDSRAYFRQDVAGGDGRPVLKRQTVSAQFDSWWSGSAKDYKPLALLGSEGVGKTFNMVAWLQENKEKLPIILLFSSGVFASRPTVNTSNVEDVIGNELLSICRIRDESYWRARVRRLLSRPEDEGFAFLFFIDGLNQEPSARWLDVFSQLQSTYFQNNISFITSTRHHTYTVALKSMRRFNPSPLQLNIGKYDLSDGGEFDQLLGLHGINRSEITESMLDIASIPRFFDLVVDMRQHLSSLKTVTFHRVLFEYGRDMRGRRDEKSFSETEWRQWLIKLAKSYHENIETTTEHELSELTGGAHLTAEEIKIRNSDIIDGSFIEKASPHNFSLDKRLVFHALGLDLLESLVVAHNLTEMNSILETWLGPLSGFDDEAEILRAALSIALQDERDHRSDVLSALLYAWLTSQNIPKMHKEEIDKQSKELLLPLLEVVERSVKEGANGSLQSALGSLETLNRSTSEYTEAVRRKLKMWFVNLSLDIGKYGKQEHGIKHDETQRTGFVDRLGTDALGKLNLLGYEFNIVEASDITLLKLGANLIQNSPLEPYAEIFKIYAIWLAALQHSSLSKEFEWLCILNKIDPVNMRTAFREEANALLSSKSENSLHMKLSQKATKNLLYLMNTPEDDHSRDQIETEETNSRFDYQKDYLNDPTNSIFSTERRHAHLVIEDSTKPLISRIEKVSDFIIDPEFSISEDVKDEAVALAGEYNLEEIDSSRGVSIDSHQFEILSLLLARVSPEKLTRHNQEWLNSLADRDASLRQDSGNGAAKKVLSADKNTAQSVRTLRLKGKLHKDLDEGYVSCNFLSCEIQGLSKIDQYRYVLDSEIEYLFDNLLNYLPALNSEDVTILFNEYFEKSSDTKRILLILLSVIPPHDICDRDWNTLESVALADINKIDSLPSKRNYTISELAFKTLALISSERFGRKLDTIGWTWTPEQSEIIGDYGSLALTSVSAGMPLIDVVSRVAPFDLAVVAEKRHENEEHLQLIVDVYTAILFHGKILKEPNAVLTVDVTRSANAPFRFSTGKSLEELAITDETERIKKMHSFSEKRQEILDEAWERVRENQREGASLYLRTVEAATLEVLISKKPTSSDIWLEGIDDNSQSFRSRVLCAEGFYLSLCECLLKLQPSKGIKLWRFLFTNLRTNFTGIAGVKYIFQIIFNAPQSDETDSLCLEFMSEKFVQSDKDVETLAILIRQGGRSDWANPILEAYLNSDTIWYRYLSLALLPLISLNSVPVNTMWREGAFVTRQDSIVMKSSLLAYKEACSFYWLKQYASAKTLEQANAAWLLLVASSSRRIKLWLVATFNENLVSFEEIKTAYADEANGQLDRRIRKANNFTESNLFGKSLSTQLRPWVSGRSQL